MVSFKVHKAKEQEMKRRTFSLSEKESTLYTLIVSFLNLKKKKKKKTTIKGIRKRILSARL